ncbi:hypothetical protein JWJ88_17265 [Paracoccus methylovorus]|uniref:Uncharacterized protein n=1 Tax=Paracoccus methylovorus TaxID=2812658 RepID=A0ABX7JM42_9RHOB|nr:hypothetical protein [Paracoccus methylovorus]QRZ14714.1 hypothetical protein JWJ88_17265 [Paracoccus methylovorus]
MKATTDQKRRFMAAVRSGRMMFGEIVKVSGLTFQHVFDIYAEGVTAGRLRMGDDAPGFRFIEEVRQ